MYNCTLIVHIGVYDIYVYVCAGLFVSMNVSMLVCVHVCIKYSFFKVYLTGDASITLVLYSAPSRKSTLVKSQLSVGYALYIHVIIMVAYSRDVVVVFLLEVHVESYLICRHMEQKTEYRPILLAVNYLDHFILFQLQL